jgi:tetratricopeptide (TPR) repeat protein
MRDEWCAMFDKGLRLRDQGALEEAIAMLHALTTALHPVEESTLLAHTWSKIGYIHDERGDLEAAALAFRRATAAAPRFELASMGLYLALWHLDRKQEALCEMERYVAAKPNSAGYRELLEGGYSGFAAEQQLLLDRVHQRLLRFN